MAVTKRTRFEVLRRDEHTCQYCGAKAPEVTLQIDHVIPVALGGDDKPGNLVTACRDCNAGKASIPPDSPLVQSLSAEAAAYALGMQDKMTRFRADLQGLEDYEFLFREVWDKWTRAEGEERVINPLPADYRASLFRWMTMGVPTTVFELAVPVANRKYNETRHMQPDGVFGYMAGVVWNMINQREIDYTVTQDTAAVYTWQEADEFGFDQYQAGLRTGRSVTSRAADAVDYVARLIDQGLAAHADYEDEWVRTMLRHWSPPELKGIGGPDGT